MVTAAGQTQFRAVVELALGALRNPAANPRAALLVFLAAGIVLLGVVLFVYLAITFVQDALHPAPAPEPPAPAEAARRQRRRRIVWAVVVCLSAALLVAGWNVGTSDAVCSRCHADEKAVASHAKESHASASCRSCHVSPGVRGVFSATVSAAGNARVQFLNWSKPVGSETVVTNEACLSCHRAITSGAVLARGIRMVHSDVLAVGYACTDCHNTAGHGTAVKRPRYPQMSQCIMCHDGVKAKSECSGCHSTDVGTVTREPGDFYVKAHIPVQTCRGCHPMKACIDCHGLELPHSLEFLQGGHARKALLQPQICAKCHSTKGFCNNCHQFAVTSKDLPVNPHAADTTAYLSWHTKVSGAGLGSCSCHTGRTAITREQFCAYCHGTPLDR